MSLQAVVSEIDRHDSFLITSHVAPEGDAVGSAMALALGLRRIGKSADVVLRDPLPRQLSFLSYQGVVFQRKAISDPVDALIAVDCGDLDRTGFFSGDRSVVGRIINIDHHVTNHKFGDVNWVAADAVAAGEMVYDLLVEMKVPITPEIATPLYTSIVSETGSYHYVNTTPKAFRMAAALAERGADPVAIARALFESQTEGRLRLMGEVFSGLRLDQSGKVAWLRVTLPMLERTGTRVEDTENLINYPSFIEGVQVAVLFRQIDSSSYKVTCRSRGNVDVSGIASRFGGGGHAYASGCILQGEAGSIEERVLAVIREEI